MSEIVPGKIERYVESHTSPLSGLLEELIKETHEKTPSPQMLTGRVEGRILRMLVTISRARRVFEIGTFTGFSALMMAEGLPKGGELITCELTTNNAAIAQKYFDRSPYGRKITLRIGPALDTMKTIPDETIDFVFIDADKNAYPQYYEESMRILRPDGIITADNTLWGGKALEPDDEESRAIAAFNDRVSKDDRAEKVMLTIRDGIYLIRKK